MGYQTAAKYADASCGTTFLSDLNTFMIANGWSATSDSPWTSVNKTARIWKSPGASNGTSPATDFYFIAYVATAGATTVYFMLGEDYNTTTHYLTKYVPTSANSGAVNAAANYTITDATGVLPDNSSSTYAYQTSVNLSVSGYTYWMSVNAQRVILSTRVLTTGYNIYSGLTTNAMDTSTYSETAVSLWHGFLFQGSYGQNPVIGAGGGFTREPRGHISTVAHSYNFAAASTTSYIWPFSLGIETADAYYKTGWAAHLCTLLRTWDFSNIIPSAFLLDTLYCGRTATPLIGDTLTINSKTYVKMSLGSVKAWTDTTV